MAEFGRTGTCGVESAMATGTDRRDVRGSRRWNWRIRVSGAVQLWEVVWRSLWPAAAVAGLFLALALFDAFLFLPGWLHALLLALFGTALALALWREFRGFRAPDYTSARRRLERVNELPHRPLEALDDTVVGGAAADPAARALWERHQQKMREAVAGLKVGSPRPRVIRRDPFALRIALSLGLILGLLAAGADAPTRLASAFADRKSVV